MARDVHPDVVERVNNGVRIAARQGHHQLEVLTFPCNYGGRRINNLLPDWSTSLEGFAKSAYEFYERELKPLGFKLTAQVVSYEGGVSGHVPEVVSRSSTRSWMSR
jgi:hypothetical protein